MKDFVVATTAGLLGNVAVLDLIYMEEKKQNCEFVLVNLQNTKKIAYVNLNCNKINIEEFKNILDISVESCDEIGEVMKKAVKDKIMTNLNPFYYK
jgi:ribonuclease PH